MESGEAGGPALQLPCSKANISANNRFGNQFLLSLVLVIVNNLVYALVNFPEGLVHLFQ